jgi:hypothetical protein
MHNPTLHLEVILQEWQQPARPTISKNKKLTADGLQMGSIPLQAALSASNTMLQGVGFRELLGGLVRGGG